MISIESYQLAEKKRRKEKSVALLVVNGIQTESIVTVASNELVGVHDLFSVRVMAVTPPGDITEWPAAPPIAFFWPAFHKQYLAGRGVPLVSMRESVRYENIDLSRCR